MSRYPLFQPAGRCLTAMPPLAVVSRRNRWRARRRRIDRWRAAWPARLRLVALEHQHRVGSPVAEGLRNPLPAARGIKGHNAALKHPPLKQCRNGRALVEPAVHPAARRAVHRHDLGPEGCGQRLHPASETAFQWLRVQPREDAPEGVVRGKPVRQRQKRLQPGLLPAAKQLDLGPAVGAADNGQGRNQETVLQGMQPGLGPTGSIDFGEQETRGTGAVSAMEDSGTSAQSPHHSIENAIALGFPSRSCWSCIHM